MKLLTFNARERILQSTYGNIPIRLPSFRKCLPFLMLLLFACGLSLGISAQKKCLSHEIRDIQNQANPETQQRRMILERQIEKYVRENSTKAGAAQVTIPVVFHVVHDGDAIGTDENLSEARLMAQLAQLNADFSRMNSDADSTPMQFQGVAVNTMIQFCLATVDPAMNATTGIVRTNISSLPATAGACWTSDYIQTNIIDPLVWNTANYLNIFTVDMIRGLDPQNNNACIDEGTLGYATFPGAPANEDVAVHLASTIGSVSMPNPLGGAVGLGRTVTHEVGHWLMLNHIWGDNGGCQDDDNVADTPIQNMDNMGCPTFPLTDACTTGGNGLMFMNYMDYVDDNCMNMFTQGQATRMMAAITNSRPGLLNNSRCGMTPANDGYTCANAIELTAPGTFNAPGPSQGNGAIAGSGFVHANWYRFTPPMSGMIRIFTCGLAGAGNQHNHVYNINTTSCATLDLDDVAYTEDRGCTNMQADGVKLEDVPVTAGVPIYIEWDNALSSTPFTWTLEYQAGGNTCTDYASTDVPKTITIATAGTITSTVTVATSGTVTDVNIKNLNGTHTWISDLTFTLMSPQGTPVILIQNLCDDNNTGFSITLDDAATNALSCPLSEGNTQKPASPLAAFNGQNPMGNWTLSVNDNVDEDGGSLTGWTLEICTNGGGGNCPPNLAVDAAGIATNTYQASIQLTSMGMINASSNVIFRAADNVELRPNFEIWPLGSLVVNIAACQ